MSKIPKTRNSYFAKWSIVLILWLVMLPWNETQAQGCECVGCNGPIPVSASNLTFTLNVSGSTNNNLSNPNQGVCGIYLDLNHNFVFALEIILTAPSGQMITLMGPPNLGNPSNFPTFFVNWDIGFLPCNESVTPDLDGAGVPFAAQWFNNQGWAAGTNYVGTYHPYLGCMENLVGSVDGPWTITINNVSPNYGGQLNGFSIVFCDDSGLGCSDCEPNAGSLFFVPDFEICQGESVPPVNLDPMYQNSPPSTDYSYTYIVSSNNVIQEYNEMTNLSTFAGGTYEVCGLSYLTSEVGQIPAPNGTMSVADLNNQIVNNGVFCGEITADCFTMTVNGPPNTVFVNAEICDDETYEIGGNSYNTTGIFSFDIPATAGCGDTTVQLDLMVHPTYNLFINEFICEGDTYFLGSTPYTTTGTYSENFISQYTCDSVVNVDLTVINPSVSIAPANELNCQQTEVNVDGSASSSGSDISYLWTTLNGSISGNPNNAVTEVDEPGEYYLEITQSGGNVSCSIIDSIIVTQDISPSMSEAGMEDTISCQITSLILNGTGSSMGNEFSYLWTTTGGGTIQNPTTLSPTIDSAGMYYLEVTNANSNCVAIDSVEIISNSVLPIVNIAGNTQIDCSIFSIQLDATASSQGPEFEYLWTASPGQIDSGADGLSPVISVAGTYELLITNVTNMCTATSSVQVTVDTLHPIADAGDDVVLNCNLPSNLLDGSGSSQGGSFSYQWTTISGGPFVGDPNTLSPQVDAAGVYELTVTNIINTCIAVSQVTVTTDFVDPIAIGGVNQTISCEDPIVELDGTGSSTVGQISYQWNVVGSGSIFSGANTLTPEIDAAGTYQLTVTNDENGCAAQSLIIEVFDDTQDPVANGGADEMINCNNLTATLDGTNSSSGIDYVYLWTASNGGNIFSGGTTLNPVVNAGGDYELMVTDTTNGCFAIDLVQVTFDTLPPTANAELDTIVNCYNTSIFLEATGSSIGTNFSYSWTTSDGNFVGTNTNLFSIEIDSAGTYELEVTNNQTGCIATDEVIVLENFTTSIADAGVDGELDCGTTSITIGGMNTSLGSDYIYQWTSPNGGSFISGQNNPTAEINAAGTYELLVTNSASGCTSLDETIVTADNDAPIAIAGDDGMINCNNATVTLNGTGSSTGADYIYQWTASNGGSIFSGGTTLMPVVDAAGTYELIVTDTTNDCTAIDDAIVTLNISPPTANAGLDTVLNCFNPSLFLEATGSSIGSDFSYEWTTIDGSFVGASNLFSVEIDSTGTYELTVTNDLTGCIAVDTVVVTGDNTASVADAGADAVIGCNSSSVTLGGTNTSIGTDYLYQWTTLNGGNFVSAQNQPTAVVNTVGEYELLVVNLFNGCFSFDTTIVTADVNVPTAIAGDDLFINCNNINASLNGTGSSVGSEFSYQWTASNGGNILSGDTTLMPVVNEEGDYQLVVTNTLNNCTAVDNAAVTIDTIPPIANAGIDTVINCYNATIFLEGTGSSTGTNISYEWNTLDGNMIGNTTSFSVEIDSAGTYELTVTNDSTGCVSVDSVIVIENFTASIADAGEDGELDCNTSSLTLGGVNTSLGANYIYQWTASNGGNIISDIDIPNAEINAAGTYELLVTHIISGCTSIDETLVTANTDVPISIAGMDTMMVCGQTSLILDGSNSSIGSQYVYHWTVSNGGSIFSGDSTLMPEVNAAGTYTLEVSDTVNNCSISSSLIVTIDTTLPIAEAGDTMYLNCTSTTITLDGSGSSSGNEFTYQWATTDGHFISDETTLNPVVDSAGFYYLTVLNTNNLCAATDSVFVLLDTIAPIADAGMDTMLTCTFLQVRLGDDAFIGNEYSYEWSTNTGNFLTPNNLDTVVVNFAGTYTLTITNLNNGCTAADEVEVTQDANLPFADAGNLDLIPCLTGELTLDGTASSMGIEFEYLWTTGNGHFVSGENTLTPTIDSAGVYLLTVTNILNNCSASEGIIVTNESCDITAEAGVAVSIGCASTIATLDGTGSSVGSNIVYLWTTSNGIILSNETTLMPQVDGIGTYVLTVEDTLLGITAQDSVEVTTSLEFPTVVATANGFLSCSDTTVFLTSNGSSSGNNFVYNWSTNEGNIVAVVGGSNVLVNQAGWYYLEVMNMTNSCSALDSVEVMQDTSLPIADAGVDTTLNCYSDTIVLDGTNSSTGGGLTYQWMTSDGNILLGDTTLAPTVDSIGTYVLTVTDPANNCSVTSSVDVTEDFITPNSAIVSPSILNCIDTVIVLDGSISSIGNDFMYQWQTSNGNIISGENTFQSSINSEGDYDLIVTNISNGCQDTSTVQVASDTIAPIAVAGLDMQLDCGVASILLDGTASTSSDVQYQWMTSNGNIISGAQTPTLEAGSDGLYVLNVLSDLNGCSATDEVLVTQPDCTPVALVALPDTITCTQTQVTLDGSASSDWTTIIYNWSTSNGTIFGVNNSPTITVTSAGDYQLTITDQLTGLTTSTSVTVFDNNENPTANAGLPDTLNCLTSSIILDGTASSIGSEFAYEWTTVNGNILNDINILTPTIDSSGTYQLEVTNTTNNCTAIADVVIEIDTIVPVADAGDDMILTCDNPTLILDGTASSTGNEFSYAWGTGSGNVLLGGETTQPQIDADGNYALAVTNTRNGCIATDAVFVDVDTILPTVNIVPPVELNCTVTSLEIDGSSSSVGSGYTYEWTTSNGNIVSGNSDLMPEVDEPGDYLFFIENNNNGCTAEENVVVTQDTIHPIAAVGVTLELNCIDTVLTIDGSASSVGSEIEYNWTTGMGNILNGANTPNPSIDEPGTYEFLVVNTNNTCTATDMVVITQDIENPIALIEPADPLNCVVPSFMLDANNSSTGQDFNYTWNTIEGNIVDGAMGTTPTINEGGIYDLTVTNSQNGCTATTSITVEQDTLMPIADAGLPMTLTCIDTVFILNGNNSSLGSEFEYLWTTTNGNIVENGNSLTPLINEPGMYQIEVLNTINQCSSTNEIQIGQDTMPPIPMIDAIGGLVITCAINTIVLDGTGSLPFNEVSFEWSTPDGNIISGPNSSSPEIDSEGNYFVVLTNDNNGCTTSSNIVITDDFEEPNIAVSMPELLTCVDTVITLSGIGSSTGNEFSYQWTSSNGNIISGQNEIQSDVNEPGLYTFVVTDNDNGCSVDTSVTVLQDIEIPMADAGLSYEFDCINPDLQLFATASEGTNFTYNWTTIDGNIVFGQNILTPIVNMNGMYTLTVTNTFNGCMNTSVATVTEDMDIPQNASFEITPPACYGEYNASINVESVFGGEPPYQFSFNSSGSFDDYSEFLYLGAGEYPISVRDADGCQWDTILVIEDPDPVVVELGEDLYIELGDEIELEAQTNIPFSDLAEVVWTTSDSIPCPDCLVQDLAPLETTGYGVTLTSQNGCITDDDILVYVENKKRVFIPNAFSPDDDGNNDVFMIYGGNGIEEVEEFMIFNRWGELVFEQHHFQPNDITFGWDGFFQGKKLNPAVFIYFTKIKYINGETEIMKGDLFLK